MGNSCVEVMEFNLGYVKKRALRAKRSQRLCRNGVERTKLISEDRSRPRKGSLEEVDGSGIERATR